MKKCLLSLILSVIIVTALMPSVVNSADSALTSVTYEKLSHEAKNCISENLTLPESVGENSVSWSSSNASVISNTGVVTRPESAPEEVILTATSGEKS